MKTMKSNYTIQNYSDLEREEIRVKRRLKKQEELIKVKLKTLPEEVVTAGITRVITGILSGDLFRSAGSVISMVKSFFKSKQEESDNSTGSGGGLMDILKTVIKDKFSK